MRSRRMPAAAVQLTELLDGFPLGEMQGQVGLGGVRPKAGRSSDARADMVFLICQLSMAKGSARQPMARDD